MAITIFSCIPILGRIRAKRQARKLRELREQRREQREAQARAWALRSEEYVVLLRNFRQGREITASEKFIDCFLVRCPACGIPIEKSSGTYTVTCTPFSMLPPLQMKTKDRDLILIYTQVYASIHSATTASTQQNVEKPRRHITIHIVWSPRYR